MVSATRSATALLALTLSISLAACNVPKPEVVPLPQVDISAYEPSVRNGLTAAQAAFDKLAASKPPETTLGAAYGELAMMYHAQDVIAPAQVAYANAHALAPRDAQWPYLLAQLHADASRLPEAIKWFEVALKINRDHAPALIGLGTAYLQSGDLAAAQKTFEHAKAIADARAAAAAGLGKVALAQQQYAEAIKQLEEALKLAPRATRLYQPLAAAYRGAGNAAKAEESSARYDIGGVDPAPNDPAADAVADRVLASRVLLRRGQRAGKAGRFDLAVQAFRAAVTADPQSAEATANLGISLANLGRTPEAQLYLERALAMDDTSAVAHLSLAVVYDRQGLDERAIAHYERTLQIEPDNAAARIYLADARMRTNATREAIALYLAALERSNDAQSMRLALAMAYVKAGDWRNALKQLEPAAAVQPVDKEATNTLARVLLTAADKSVFAPQRGLTLAKTLFEQTRSPEVGQTYAMAFAANGNFTEAIKLQEETLIAYERSKVPVDRAFLERNLARYRAHKPAEGGWSPRDPRLNPRSPATQLQAPVSPPSAPSAPGK